MARPPQVLATKLTSERALDVARDWEAGPPQERAATGHPNRVLSEDAAAGIAATQLADTVIKALFSTGLQLQAVMPMTPEPVAHRLAEAVEDIDLCIREVRHVILDPRD